MFCGLSNNSTLIQLALKNYALLRKKYRQYILALLHFLELTDEIRKINARTDQTPARAFAL